MSAGYWEAFDTTGKEPRTCMSDARNGTINLNILGGC